MRLTAGIAEHDAVPLVYVVSVLARKIVEHAEAVSNNDQHMAEAARRATATQAVLDTLKGADFPSAHPAYVAIVEALAQICEYASKWGDKSYWTKRLGVSLSKCTMKSLKYKHLFELQFQVRMAVGIRKRAATTQFPADPLPLTTAGVCPLSSRCWSRTSTCSRARSSRRATPSSSRASRWQPRNVNATFGSW